MTKKSLNYWKNLAYVTGILLFITIAGLGGLFIKAMYEESNAKELGFRLCEQNNALTDLSNSCVSKLGISPTLSKYDCVELVYR